MHERPIAFQRQALQALHASYFAARLYTMAEPISSLYVLGVGSHLPFSAS